MADVTTGPQHTPRSTWTNGKNVGDGQAPEPKWVKGKESGSQFDQNPNVTNAPTYNRTPRKVTPRAS
jgi:hypothetical protein